MLFPAASILSRSGLTTIGSAPFPNIELTREVRPRTRGALLCPCCPRNNIPKGSDRTLRIVPGRLVQAV